MPVIIVAALAGASAGGDSSRPGRATPREDALAILGREGCQTDLPIGAGASLPVEARASSPGSSGPPVEVGLPAFALPSFAAVLVVVLAAAGLAALLLSLHRRAEQQRLPGVAERPGDRPRRREIPDHERLAQDSRFAEAIHALLLHALARLSERNDVEPQLTAPSRTSREVLHSGGLEPELRAALTPLVASVESVYFGATPASIDEYRACVVRYRALEAACRAVR